MRSHRRAQCSLFRRRERPPSGSAESLPLWRESWRRSSTARARWPGKSRRGQQTGIFTAQPTTTTFSGITWRPSSSQPRTTWPRTDPRDSAPARLSKEWTASSTRQLRWAGRTRRPGLCSALTLGYPRPCRSSRDCIRRLDQRYPRGDGKRGQ
jgi:hypothetical protein